MLDFFVFSLFCFPSFCRPPFVSRKRRRSARACMNSQRHEPTLEYFRRCTLRCRRTSRRTLRYPRSIGENRGENRERERAVHQPCVNFIILFCKRYSHPFFRIWSSKGLHVSSNTPKLRCPKVSLILVLGWVFSIVFSVICNWLEKIKLSCGIVPILHTAGGIALKFSNGEVGVVRMTKSTRRRWICCMCWYFITSFCNSKFRPVAGFGCPCSEQRANGSERIWFVGGEVITQERRDV